MKTIGLIRHGTTEWNLAGRMQGQMDTPLAEAGRVQARLLGRRLASEQGWDGIIASDLTRAAETAQIVAAASGIPLIGTDSRLRERSFGQVEGTTREERIARFGEGWRELDLGVESDEKLLTRWDSFLGDAEKDHAGRRLLIITHGGYIAPIVQRVLGRMIEENLDNTSLTVLDRDGDRWSVPLINCTEHLREMGLSQQG